MLVNKRYVVCGTHSLARSPSPPLSLRVSNLTFTPPFSYSRARSRTAFSSPPADGDFPKVDKRPEGTDGRTDGRTDDCGGWNPPTDATDEGSVRATHARTRTHPHTYVAIHATEGGQEQEEECRERQGGPRIISTHQNAIFSSLLHPSHIMKVHLHPFSDSPHSDVEEKQAFFPRESTMPNMP